MNLLPDWEVVIKKAWSVRLMIIAAVLSAAEVVLPFFQDTIPRGTFAVLSALSVSGAFIARIVVQKNLND